MENVAVTELGRTRDGRTIERYALRNRQGLSADLMTYGATLMALRTPDRDGRFESIVLGFDTLEPYLAGTPCFGATVGRFANRIAGARFVLDGHEYKLAANDGENQLHGGVRGFDKVVWRGEALSDSTSAGVVFFYVSPDGEEGYPGALTVEVTYRLTDDDRLTIDYRAVTTKPTPVNLTHHSYFNLSGEALRPITGHVLQVAADRFAPVDSGLIPTGELRDVTGTAFDFRDARPIGSRLAEADEQLVITGGYDHSFALNTAASAALTQTASLSEPQSGRVMEVWTTEPALQVYSGNSLDGSLRGPHGPFARRTGVCLEPQHFPNAPNEPRFPSTVLRPGAEYRSRTELRFKSSVLRPSIS